MARCPRSLKGQYSEFLFLFTHQTLKPLTREKCLYDVTAIVWEIPGRGKFNQPVARLELPEFKEVIFQSFNLVLASGFDRRGSPHWITKAKDLRIH